MFKWPFNKKEDKPVIVCIHGFGRRRTHEFDCLVAYLNDYTFIIPELYDQTDTNDDRQEDWLNRAESSLLEASRTSRRIILIGYSMGGAIACYLASKFRVEKLILLAPALEYLTITTATSAIMGVFSKTTHTDEYAELPRNFSSTFRSVVDYCKDSINHVQCPILILHDSKDDVIPSSVSEKVFEKLDNKNKLCIILQGGSHRLMEDKQLSSVTFFMIKNYIEKKY